MSNKNELEFPLDIDSRIIKAVSYDDLVMLRDLLLSRAKKAKRKCKDVIHLLHKYDLIPTDVTLKLNGLKADCLGGLSDLDFYLQFSRLENEKYKKEIKLSKDNTKDIQMSEIPMKGTTDNRIDVKSLIEQVVQNPEDLDDEVKALLSKKVSAVKMKSNLIRYLKKMDFVPEKPFSFAVPGLNLSVLIQAVSADNEAGAKKVLEAFTPNVEYQKKVSKRVPRAKTLCQQLTNKTAIRSWLKVEVTKTSGVTRVSDKAAEAFLRNNSGCINSKTLECIVRIAANSTMLAKRKTLMDIDINRAFESLEILGSCSR